MDAAGARSPDSKKTEIQNGFQVAVGVNFR
jgi:hypothetical protein